MISKIVPLTPWIVLGIGLIIIVIWQIIKKHNQNKSLRKKTISINNTKTTSVVTPTNPATTNTSVTTTKKTNSWTVFWNIVATVAIIFVAIMLFLIVSSITRSCDRPRTSGNSTPPQTYVAPVKTSQTFQFDETRMFSVDLKAGWKDYPKGGKIKIKAPGGYFLEDEPGVDKNFGYQPDGRYVFYALESKTEAVEIYNYW